MKNNHEEVKNFIKKAISSCKDDYVFAEVKKHLYHALTLVEKVGDKRVGRDNQNKAFQEEAKKRNQQWMEMLKKNLKLKDDYDEERID
jgi:hypothetical protein